MHEWPSLHMSDTVAHICCCCSKWTIEELLGTLFPGCKSMGWHDLYSQYTMLTLLGGWCALVILSCPVSTRNLLWKAAWFKQCCPIEDEVHSYFFHHSMNPSILSYLFVYIMTKTHLFPGGEQAHLPISNENISGLYLNCKIGSISCFALWQGRKLSFTACFFTL